MFHAKNRQFSRWLARLGRSNRAWGLLLCGVVILGCESRRSDAPPDVASDSETKSASGLSAPIAGSPVADGPQTAIAFSEISDASGVQFTPRNGADQRNYSILETIGVGVAWCDFQNDGQLDLFVPGGGGFGSGPTVTGLAPGCFMGRSGKLIDVAHSAGLTDATLYSHGAVVADYDSDGCCDILVTGYGGLRLFHNQGDGTFFEIAERAGLKSSLWSVGAAWGDFNGDGHLDLYVTNYVDWSFQKNPECFMGKRTVCSPIEFDAQADQLFLADGQGGFVPGRLPDVPAGKGLACMAGDFDLDGDIDVYVANDTTPNLLFENDAAGQFAEVGIPSGVAFGDSASSDGSMGIDAGDFNLDGQIDLWVANYEGQSFALYRNIGGMLYRHDSARTGITTVGGYYVGFGTAFVDLDCDGDEDLVCANGHVTDASVNAGYQQVPLLFENRDGKFVNVAPQAGDYFRGQHVARGLAIGDIDRDGRPDLAIAHTNSPIAILRNTSEPHGKWLSLQLVGRRSPRTAIGAVIRISPSDNPQRSQVRLVKSGNSYLSTHEDRVFFGLGQTERVDVEIVWPAGGRSQVTGLAVNQHMIIVEE